MADPKLLKETRNKQKPVEIPGGNTRSSLVVSLDKYPQIQRRQDVNRRLVEHSCANEDKGGAEFHAEDVSILLQIALERAAHPGNLIRRQAIQALVQFPTLEVAKGLAAIADSAVEHESVRVQALAALTQVSPELGAGTLVKHLADDSPLVRLSSAKRLAEVGDLRSMTHLAAVTRTEKSPEVLAQAAAAVEAISKRFGVAAPKFKRPARVKISGKPAEDK